MKKNAKNIIFAASEVVPFAKTGGLADVASALPKALCESGNNVQIFMPLYKGIKEKYQLTKDIEISFSFQSVQKTASVYKSHIPGTKVETFFLDEPSYFMRPALYQENGVDYNDNAERFAFFSLGLFEWCKAKQFSPDIIHCHDWQSALVPVYLKTRYSDEPLFNNTATVFTIHNIAYQGLFPRETLYKLDLPDSVYTIDGLEYWGQISILKGGLQFADYINTVSKRYADEIASSPEFGRGLEGLLTSKKDILSGIINGLDYDEWNPLTDQFLPVNYDKDSVEKKEELKQLFMKEIGISNSKDTPLIGMISRLDDQKGWDLLAEGMPELLKSGVNFVILGTGDPKYHEMLEKMKSEYVSQVAVFLKFDNTLAHKIYAASDIFLMPSHFEPCGLGQLISLKYGTVPVVRETGGLADTIKDLNADKKGNGFSFKDYTSQALIDAVKRAVDLYSKKRSWKPLAQRIMKEDWSWKTSAKEYLKLYDLAKRNQTTSAKTFTLTAV